MFWFKVARFCSLSCLDPKDVHAVIIHRYSHQVPVITGVYCDVSRLIISDTSPNVLNNAQNKNTVSALMIFLRRQGASERRPQRAKLQGDFLSSSGSTEGAGAAQSHEHLQSGAFSESEAMDLSDDPVCQSAVDPIEKHFPFDEEPSSRQMFSDSYNPWLSEDFRHRETMLDTPQASQFHSTKPQYQHISLDDSQLQPPEHVRCESVDRDSVLSAAASQGKRLPKKAASWSKGRKHRPSVQQMRFEAQGAGDWTSTPGGSVKSYQITKPSSIAVNQHLSKEV